METHKPLLKDADGEDVDEHMYRSMIGSLMYLTSSRPDIMFSVCQPKLGLWYPKDSPFDLVAYTDSDYAGASLDRKSTTGGCQFLGCRLISWQCKKQTVVANSTIEVEYVVASSCCGQVLWIQNQLLNYGYNFMHTKIYIDNESTICIVKNLVFHSKTKHIEIRHHFIRDSNEKKLIQMIKIHTDKNIEDLLTKSFDFWATTKVETVNGEVQLHALVDRKKVIITESTIKRDLQLEDAGGIDCLHNATIFEQLTHMGYEKLSQTLTFYKAFFSPQWKFLIHTILQCLSAKSTTWNEFSSTMAFTIICLATNQKFNFSKYIFESMVKNVDSSVKFLMYPRVRKGFSGAVTPLFPTMIVQAQEEMGEELIADEAANEENVPTHSNDPLLSGEDGLKLVELMTLCTNLQNRFLDLEHTKTTQALEIKSLKRRVNKLEKKKRSRTSKLKRLFKVGRSAQVVFSEDEGLGDQEDASKQGRKITNIDQNAEVTLVDETQGSTVEVSVAATITTKEITLAQALAELRSAKPKDKGKVKMIEPEKPLKMKEQIRLDEEIAFKLQAKEEEQARLAREKAEEVEEANISWDNVARMREDD
ncbi:hypothetical protein Tco_0213311 [Tanacetum coccineum]